MSVILELHQVTGDMDVQDRRFGSQLDHLEQQMSSGESSAILEIQSMRRAVEAMCHDTKGQSAVSLPAIASLDVCT